MEDLETYAKAYEARDVLIFGASRLVVDWFHETIAGCLMLVDGRGDVENQVWRMELSVHHIQGLEISEANGDPRFIQKPAAIGFRGGISKSWRLPRTWSLSVKQSMVLIHEFSAMVTVTHCYSHTPSFLVLLAKLRRVSFVWSTRKLSIGTSCMRISLFILTIPYGLFRSWLVVLVVLQNGGNLIFPPRP